MNKIIIGAYWGPRLESRVENAIRLAAFFEKIKNYDQSLAVWELPGPNKMCLGTNVHDVTLSLRDLYSTESENPPVDPSLGRAFGAWRPTGSSYAKINGNLGSTSKNNVVITTREGEFIDELLVVMFKALVETFDPDTAIINGGSMLGRAYSRLDDASAQWEFPPLSAEPAWCNYKRGMPISSLKLTRDG